MMGLDIPLWAAVPATLLLVLGGALALIGGIGLLRLPDFYQRMHAPTLSNTLGCGCVLLASLLCFSALEGRIVPNQLLIVLFIAITSPLTSMLLIKAAMYRQRRTRPRERDDMPKRDDAQLE
jgi:monovalent cation/proton antiporter, MnhG/PhaG subunit